MKNIFNYIFFFCSAIAVHSQVNLAVIPDARDLRADQELTLTIILEIKGDEFAQQSPLQLMDTSKFNMIGSASRQNTDINAETKKVINQFVYQIVLQPKKEGKIKIGSALVTVNNKIYKTEPFDIYVSKAEAKPLAKADLAGDMYLNLEIKDKNIYKNQPTLAVLKVYSRNIDNFRNLTQIKTPQNSNVNFRPVNFKKSDIEQSSTGKMASQVVAVFLISTTESGSVNVPAVSAVVRNNTKKATLKSNKVSLNVKKLPENEPPTYKNAVGNFNVDLSADSAETHPVGEPINVKIKVSGEGNFKTMVLPKLTTSPDYTFFPPKIIYNTKSSENGFSGNVELQYVVIPKKSGRILLQTEGFSFFNPEKNLYENIESDTLSLLSLSQEEISEAKSTLEKVNDYTSNVLETVDTEKILSNHVKNSMSEKINYKALLANFVLICGLLFFVFRYRKKKKFRRKNPNVPLPIVENVSEVEARLQSEKPLDLDLEVDYLEKLKNEKDNEAFFRNYDALVINLERFAQNKYHMSFPNYLQKEKGAKEAEDFNTLKQEFAVEKFAPFQSEEEIETLFLKLKKILSDVKE